MGTTGGIDYEQFSKFYKDVATLSLDFDTWIRRFLYLEGLRLVREMKTRTPVDTGKLRRRWKLEGDIVIDEGALTCWFVNTADYSEYVEYGHAPPYKSGLVNPGDSTWIDGYFMMTVSLDVVEAGMPARFNTSLRKFVREHSMEDL